MTTSSPLRPAQAPRRSAMARRDAMRLAATEYTRMSTALGRLATEDWTKPTPCPDWDVRQLACHMVGMATMATSPWESARQQKIAGADVALSGGPGVDALTALQVRERASLTPQDVVVAARRVGPRAARGRRLTPFFIRRKTLPEPQSVNGRDEVWTLGYLIDVILTRDPWMHRIDLSDATGQTLELTGDHDGAIIDDVVREWADRHGRACRVELGGPAGGEWSWTERPGVPESISMDAIDFCRTVSGRRSGGGLLTTQVPF